MSAYVHVMMLYVLSDADRENQKISVAFNFLFLFKCEQTSKDSFQALRHHGASLLVLIQFEPLNTLISFLSVVLCVKYMFRTDDPDSFKAKSL